MRERVRRSTRKQEKGKEKKAMMMRGGGTRTRRSHQQRSSTFGRLIPFQSLVSLFVLHRAAFAFVRAGPILPRLLDSWICLQFLCLALCLSFSLSSSSSTPILHCAVSCQARCAQLLFCIVSCLSFSLVFASGCLMLTLETLSQAHAIRQAHGGLFFRRATIRSLSSCFSCLVSSPLSFSSLLDRMFVVGLGDFVASSCSIRQTDGGLFFRRATV